MHACVLSTLLSKPCAPIVRLVALIKFEFVDITPRPAFARLDRLHDRMLRRVEMLGRVLVLRTVTAANVTTVKTHAQVNPGIASLQALFTTLRVGADVADRVEVCTLLRHGVLRSGGYKNCKKVSPAEVGAG